MNRICSQLLTRTQLLGVSGFDQVQEKVDVILGLAGCLWVKHEPLHCAYWRVV